MKHKRYGHGFTIIELMTVIAIVAILATIVTIQYSSVQRDARDHQVRDAAAKFAEAIETWAVRHDGAMPYGGQYSATTGTPGGDKGCTNMGTEGWQNANYPDAGGYSCTVGDVMLYHSLLESNFFTALPPNTKYGNNQTNFMTVPCPSDASQTLLLYALEDPTKAEMQNFTSAMSSCGQSNTHAADGMNALIILDARR